MLRHAGVRTYPDPLFRSPPQSLSLQSLIAWLENSPQGKRVEIQRGRESNMDWGYKWCTSPSGITVGSNGTRDNHIEIRPQSGLEATVLPELPGRKCSREGMSHPPAKSSAARNLCTLRTQPNCTASRWQLMKSLYGAVVSSAVAR